MEVRFPPDTPKLGKDAILMDNKLVSCFTYSFLQVQVLILKRSSILLPSRTFFYGLADILLS